ncbi:Probable amino-acid metabolite efflux pump [Neisseria zoodegmatis]|uniref:Probable amino-acid metabolite efflux pump n=1 Tax=Neisseria zoodegmatis TaxID=326523 RepID=A0A378WH38_9NEIS|nr:EamA family transporter [Neisseria zoodegmatis]SUA36629.1 Probable amino-acid metabolite efflux pump [Neisseria zoodegmatis]
MNLKDYLLILLVIGIWGVNFLFMKFALNEIPPMVLGMLRFFCVVFPAVFLLKRPPVPWHLLAAYGLTISFGQFALMFTALHWGLPTGLAALMLQVQVFFTVLIAGIVLREPVLAHHLLGMFTAAVGLVFIGIGHYQGRLPITAMLPVFGAAASWACGNIIVKRIGSVNALSLVVWGGIPAFCAFTLASLMLYGTDGLAQHVSNLTWKGIVGILFLAYVASLVGYTGWGALLAKHPAGRVTPFALLVPVIALLAGYLVLNERLAAWHWLGIVVVMAGLTLHIFGSKWRRAVPDI